MLEDVLVVRHRQELGPHVVRHAAAAELQGDRIEVLVSQDLDPDGIYAVRLGLGLGDPRNDEGEKDTAGEYDGTGHERAVLVRDSRFSNGGEATRIEQAQARSGDE